MAKKAENKALPLLAGAIVFGIIAALLSMLYLKSREAAILARLKGPEVPDISVVVARSNLVKGQQITADSFAVRKIPQNFVHDDAVYPGEFDRYIGRSLVANLGAGKTLLKSFMDETFPIDFSDIIPMGKRAMTVTVDDINSIGGHLRPGNRVDLYVNIPFSASGFSPQLFTAARESGVLDSLPPDLLQAIPMELIEAAADKETAEQILSLAAPSDVILPVVQNVRVLATGGDSYKETLDRLRQPQQRREGHFNHITVEVDPQQAALITLAQDKGEMLSLLRNRNDSGASSFTNVSPSDLFSNASRMAAQERERTSRAAIAAGVDVNGNLVDADGNKLMDRQQLAAAGFSVNENGQIVDQDGNIVDPRDIVVSADGTVMTRQQLAAAGLTVNENGQIVDKNGKVVSANDVVVLADGSVMTKAQLAAAGLSVNEQGEIVDASGKVLSPNEIVVTSDGKVLTKEQLAAAGLRMNENGEIVDQDGNVVKPENLIVSADGSILSNERLAAAGLRINEQGEIVDKNGNVVDPKDLVIASDGSVMTKEQLAAAGLKINENGELVDRNGNVVDPNDLITSADGTVLSKKALAQAGYSVNEQGEIVDSTGRKLSAEEIAKAAEQMVIVGDVDETKYDLVVGGSSEDGVAKTRTVTTKK